MEKSRCPIWAGRSRTCESNTSAFQRTGTPTGYKFEWALLMQFLGAAGATVLWQVMAGITCSDA